MDKKQIIKKIEEKIDNWGSITFFTLTFLLIIIPFIYLLLFHTISLIVKIFKLSLELKLLIFYKGIRN